MSIFIGDNGVNKKVKKLLVGNNGVNIKPKKLYIGDGGSNKLVYKACNNIVYDVSESTITKKTIDGDIIWSKAIVIKADDNNLNGQITPLSNYIPRSGDYSYLSYSNDTFIDIGTHLIFIYYTPEQIKTSTSGGYRTYAYAYYLCMINKESSNYATTPIFSSKYSDMSNLSVVVSQDNKYAIFSVNKETYGSGGGTFTYDVIGSALLDENNLHTIKYIAGNDTREDSANHVTWSSKPVKLIKIINNKLILLSQCSQDIGYEDTPNRLYTQMFSHAIELSPTTFTIDMITREPIGLVPDSYLDYDGYQNPSKNPNHASYGTFFNYPSWYYRGDSSSYHNRSNLYNNVLVALNGVYMILADWAGYIPPYETCFTMIFVKFDGTKIAQKFPTRNNYYTLYSTYDKQSDNVYLLYKTGINESYYETIIYVLHDGVTIGNYQYINSIRTSNTVNNMNTWMCDILLNIIDDSLFISRNDYLVELDKNNGSIKAQHPKISDYSYIVKNN